jgi:hypothetical protein
MLATQIEANWHDLTVCNEFLPEKCQNDRILAALGPLGDRSPSVDDETTLRYYQYLVAHISFPFTAYYPVPKRSEEEVEYRCTVVELLDPRKHIGSEFDGIFCKARKGRFEVNLPLTELNVPEDSPNFQFIEDYWYSQLTPRRRWPES